MKIGVSFFSWRGRIICRGLHTHGLTCRGRTDHHSKQGHWPNQTGHRWTY